MRSPSTSNAASPSRLPTLEAVSTWIYTGSSWPVVCRFEFSIELDLSPMERKYETCIQSNLLEGRAGLFCEPSAWKFQNFLEISNKIDALNFFLNKFFSIRKWKFEFILRDREILNNRRRRNRWLITFSCNDFVARNRCNPFSGGLAKERMNNSRTRERRQSSVLDLINAR